MSEFDRLEKQAKILKERYKPGMRIELIHMGSDPQRSRTEPVEPWSESMT